MAIYRVMLDHVDALLVWLRSGKSDRSSRSLFFLRSCASNLLFSDNMARDREANFDLLDDLSEAIVAAEKHRAAILGAIERS